MEIPKGEESKYNSENSSSNFADNQNIENLIFKIVILGDSGVGKTSTLHYYVFNKCKNFINKLKRILNILLRWNFLVKR